ncbi:hypothetical protein PAUR_a1043 [Pseudoalteromonas aurantia 208]|uniref:Uncharacterized protein n=1 Tax=Pseudoalteromonas aurantia 208 TaxID=1314867 RepID=A0ABR9EA04_9GAMM|nr:hypothetical protein [Pseudoalteromonas aurantia 208]
MFNIKALLCSNSGLLLHKSNTDSEENSFIGQIRLSRAEVTYYHFIVYFISTKLQQALSALS